ncbi:MAG: transposase [Planctomycetes bacterium]|nr:transposase [Planctomycetota bacterium]
MSRAVRVEHAGAWYHVMARGVARMPTFLDDEDRRAFLRKLGRLMDRGALEIHSFCLMPNHYHLLVRTPRGELARWMRHVNGEYVRGFNYRHRRVGHLWQGRYKAILVEDGRYLKECSRYIYLNPNRAKITRPAERYFWSSYRNYVGGGPRAVAWVETRAVLREFEGDRKAYRAYVEAGKGERPVSRFEGAVAGLVLGSEEFVVRVRRMLSGRQDPGETPSLRILARGARPAPEAVERVVEKVFADAGPARKGRLTLWAQRAHSGLRPVEIARRYSRRHSSVAMAHREVEEESRTDPDLRRRLAEVAHALAQNGPDRGRKND